MAWRGIFSQFMSFENLGLSPKVLSAVTAAGFTTPTPIQAQAIPHAVTGRDVLGIAQTGTGKTASFALPMLTRLERGRAPTVTQPRKRRPARKIRPCGSSSRRLKCGICHLRSVALALIWKLRNSRPEEAMRPDWYLREGCESLKAKLAC